ncbi:alpha/beta hydrolase fold domain-containing protein [bacterium]|nr:alpha/beta hydrolase fold domain-containing protein [bacterium]
MHDVTIEHDICYAKAAGQELCLDIYRPDVSGDVPVVLYLHGGGWARGDKRDFAERLERMAANGVAVASANYRLVPEFVYPTNIQDAKAAVRWLRANGRSRGLSVGKIGAWGASAGGYIAVMVGLTAGDDELEGEVGDHLDQSSAVQAVVSWFSLHDFMTTSYQSPLEKRLQGKTLAAGLFGVDEVAGDNPVVRNASPVRRIRADAPPFLIAHGDCDSIVQASESANLLAAFSREGIDATLCLIAAAGHEDPKFDSVSNLAMTAAWLKAKLEP